MNNKVLIKLLVPDIDMSYDIYLPVNKKIGNIIVLLNKAVSEMSNGSLPISNYNSLYNAETNERYNIDTLISNTDIRNNSKLILLS